MAMKCDQKVSRILSDSQLQYFNERYSFYSSNPHLETSLSAPPGLSDTTFCKNKGEIKYSLSAGSTDFPFLLYNPRIVGNFGSSRKGV